MSWTWANPLMLLGLLGVAIPVIIHLLNRRRNVVVDWGAMQFLDVGRRARQKIRLTDGLLMASRMLILGLVALALARPLLTPKAKALAATGGGAAGLANTRRDVVLVLDGSASMGRKGGGTTADAQAREWATEFVRQLPSGSTVALLLAREQPRALVDSLSLDMGRVTKAIGSAARPLGSSDIPAALVEALGLLERGENAACDIVVLSDGQKLPWRGEESQRWQLLRELRRELARKRAVEPRIWAIHFGAKPDATGADGAVGRLELARTLVPPRLPIELRTSISNAGPQPLVATAELLIDGVPQQGMAQAVGPVAPGSQTPLSFRLRLDEPGNHLLGVRLSGGDDPLASNDLAERAVHVMAALPVLLVDGEPAVEAFSGEVDFLRAALAPTGDDTPQIVTRVIEPDALNSQALEGQRVVVLANVERVTLGAAEAVARFLDTGGGVLVAPGDRVDPDAANSQLVRGGLGWLPATLRAWRAGDKAAGQQVLAHPSPTSFSGPFLSPLAEGDQPALASAQIFGYWVLEPIVRVPAASVLARLDNGDPWVVERPYRRGQVIVLSTPLDAEGGTLPVNADFVPLVHELVFHLADSEPREPSLRPGEPVLLPIDPPPALTLKTIDVRTPSGLTATAPIEREGNRARARLAVAEDPGTYRFALPSGAAYVAVAGDERESAVAALTAADQQALSANWPLVFAGSGEDLTVQLAGASSARIRPLWRLLILAALGGLCLEVYLTRRIVRGRGIADWNVDE